MIVVSSTYTILQVSRGSNCTCKRTNIVSLSSTNLQYIFYVAYILIYFEVALKNYSILPGIL